MEDYMRVPAVARLIGKTQAAIRKAIKEGRIKAFKLNKRDWGIPFSEIEMILEGGLPDGRRKRKSN